MKKTKPHSISSPVNSLPPVKNSSENLDLNY